jgi:hypothetical protein
MAWGPDFLNFAIVVAGLVLILGDNFRKSHTLKRFPVSFSIVLVAAAVYLFLLGFAEMFGNVLLARLSWVFEVLADLLVVSWIEHVLKERPRTWVLVILSIIGGASMALAFNSGAITFNSGNATGGGTFVINGTIFLLMFYVYGLIFILTIIAKAPPLGKAALALVLVFFLFDFIQPFIFPSLYNWFFWPYVAGLSQSAIYVIFFLILILHPEYLSVISFALERILVLNFDSGMPIFHYSWRSMPTKKQSENFELLGPLLQALLSMSFEVLDRGHITSVKMDDGVLIFKKGEHVIAGIIGSRSTAILEQQLAVFTNAFEIKFHDDISKPMADMRHFEEARQLVERVFRVIPVDSMRISFHRKGEARDHLSPDSPDDAQLIQDMKDVFETET